MPHLKYSFLSLHCNIFEAASVNPLPSSRDAAAFFATLRRRKERSQYYGEIASPTLDEATKWLEGRAKYLASQSEEEAVLVLYVSTHGFESNGDLHLCLRDSSQAKGAQSMLSLSALEKLLVPFWEGDPKRRIVLLLQTCRERPVPEQAKGNTLEEIWAEKKQWSVFFATRSGGQARGTERAFSLRDEEFGVAYGTFTKVFLEKWREKELPSNLGDLSEEVRHTLQELREDAIFVGQKDLIWPPLKKKSPPPPEFRDKRFQSLEKGETLLGRERVLFAALGRWLDKDTDRKGWLENSKDVVCLHGPSGGGKSSLVKAGFLPHLQGAVYADLSKEPFPEAKEKNIIFLDQIEGFLNETRFEKLIGFLKKAKEKASKTVLVVRSDAEPEFQRLWYAYASNEWYIDYRVVEVLTETEVEDVIDGSLPADIAQNLPNGWRNQLFRTISQVGRGGSPALLQLVLWDLNHTKKLRPLKEIWEDIWKTTVKGPLEREMIAIVSAFCPLEERAIWQKRRVWHEKVLIEWLSLRDFHTEDIRTALERLLEAHWLTRGQEDGQSALVLTHDLLLPFLTEQLRNDRQERKQRGFARRLYTTLLSAQLDSKQTLLAAHLKEEFAPHELAMLSRHTQFWWQWVKKEALDSSTDIPSQIAFEGALEDLLVVQRRKYRQIWQTSATVGFLLLLFGIGWYWKVSIESNLISEMEVCTEAQEKILPFHKFQRCTKALARSEKLPWDSIMLHDKIFKIFESFQAKEVPIRWWSVVPSTLERVRDFFVKRISNAREIHTWRVWGYLLQVSIQTKESPKLMQKEISLLSSPSHTLGWEGALVVWKLWTEGGGKSTPRERSVWLKMLQESNQVLQLKAVELWKAFIKKGGKPSSQERSAFLKLLQDSGTLWRVKGYALGLWATWVNRGGKPNSQERSAWLSVLTESSDELHKSGGLILWKAFIKKGGKPTFQERAIWLKLLRDEIFWARKNVLEIWSIWVKGGGKPTLQERTTLLIPLQDSNGSVRQKALEFWSIWVKRGGKPTLQERTTLLIPLQDSDGSVRQKALEFWSIWVKRGGKPTLQERTVLLDMLQDSDGSVRQKALEFWSIWVKRGSTLTLQEKLILVGMLQSIKARARLASVSMWSIWVKGGGKPTLQERTVWLKLLRDSNAEIRREVLILWKAWVKGGGKPTLQERAAWFDMLQDRISWVQWEAKSLWKTWAERDEKPTLQQRIAWLGMIQSQDTRLREAGMVAWKAWINKRNVVSIQDRLEWVGMLQSSKRLTRITAAIAWKEWIEKGGKPTLQERTAFLKLLRDSDWAARFNALMLWKMWIEKGSKPNFQERTAFLKITQCSDEYFLLYMLNLWEAWLKIGGKPTLQERKKWLEMFQCRIYVTNKSIVKLLEVWIKRGGKPTLQERKKWLEILKNHDYRNINENMLYLYEGWIKRGGKPTLQERTTLFKLLKHLDGGIRKIALRVWVTWFGEGGKPTSQERTALLPLLQDSEVDGYRLGSFSILRLLKDDPHTTQKIEEWLAQTVAWNEVKGGVKAIQARLALDPKLAIKLLSSRYPIFQRVAREAIAKKTVTSSSHSSTPTQKTPPATSQPSSVRSSQPTTSQPAPIHKP